MATSGVQTQNKLIQWHRSVSTPRPQRLFHSTWATQRGNKREEEENNKCNSRVDTLISFTRRFGSWVRRSREINRNRTDTQRCWNANPSPFSLPHSSAGSCERRRPVNCNENERRSSQTPTGSFIPEAACSSYYIGTGDFDASNWRRPTRPERAQTELGSWHGGVELQGCSFGKADSLSLSLRPCLRNLLK